MTILVTGGTGFVGGALVRHLLKDHAGIRVLARTPAKARDLQALGVEVVKGDVLDPNSLKAALNGVDTLFHVAAVYDFWMPRKSDIVTIAVQGTQNVLQAALESGVKKVVFTSSYNTIGEKPGTVGTEETVHRGPYYAVYEQAKVESERVALEYVQKGLPVVIVNPGSVYGPGDFKPTGMVFLQAMQGKLPGVVDGFYNYVYIDDVARGHILAAEKGKMGERYLLAGPAITVWEFIRQGRALLGLGPVLKFPYWMVMVVACVMEGFSMLTRKPPMIPIDLVRVSRYGIHVDGSKAVQELGLQYTPLEVGLPRTLEWYHRQGIIKRPPIKRVDL
ncbi:NAD-dependent epimerase/dehydratase family protein [Deinococcus roseus]|uniref:Dihydroflavonol-4-reductase n=1 Tax=Deinococcus roseus TaxID=392414 RepID=A0ABQ2DD77_9DEIO|nr:NAD-dependent epimerase/dehydratase family protein [Deinococcus roseus]GGJ54060.1 dihydroflavonol-4-reductase [Deinococcus roseus]